MGDLDLVAHRVGDAEMYVTAEPALLHIHLCGLFMFVKAIS